MSHRYIPLTEKDKQEMLQTIGAKSIGELFGDVPSDILLNRDLNIAESEAETTLLRRLNRIASKNITKETHTSFLGAGVYDHYAISCGCYDFKIRILHSIYAISTGNFSR